MRLLLVITTFLAAIGCCAANSADEMGTASSRNLLSPTFKPPQNWKNSNVLRLIELSKAYVRETVSLSVEHVGTGPQQEYYWAVPLELLPHIGSIEVREKKLDAPKLNAELVEYDAAGSTQFYKITFQKALRPTSVITLTIKTAYLDILKPVPKYIDQDENQFLVWEGSRYLPSAYRTVKQRTRVKLPTSSIASYTKTTDEKDTSDPEVAGSLVTYGPYEDEPAGAYDPIYVRYEHSTPIVVVERLERDVEVSHWGGNLAVEERYIITNSAARLKNFFSRVQWQRSSANNPRSVAVREMQFPLPIGAREPYYTDEIGNVSTSHFRSNAREALLQMVPRYPIFGGWNTTFTIGWNQDLSRALRKDPSGEYVLKIPFFEGPGNSQYHRVHLRVILPEGATDVDVFCPHTLVKNEMVLHKTFLDSVGRTTLILNAINLVDDARNQDLVVTYKYTTYSGLRKPARVIAGMAAAFVSFMFASRLDIRIGS